MRKLSIYLDTSVINFLFADDAPEKKEVTIDFFEGAVKNKVYDVWISSIVIDEISKTREAAKKADLLDVIRSYQIPSLNIEPYQTEMSYLAEKYIEQGIIPVRKLEDALHIAISTIFQVDILLSWNYKHLANVNKERQIMVINLAEGYTKPFKLITPMEVAYE